MSITTRRDFFSRSGKVAAVLFAAHGWELEANPLGMPIGCQTYPVRKTIARDFPGTLGVLASAGFQTIEMCSPVGYANAGFGELRKYRGSDLRKIIEDANLKCRSSHFDMAELRKDMPGRIAWAKELGLTQMMVPSLDGAKNPTMDEVKRLTDEYNKMGAESAKAGIQQGLHNEGFEESTVEGKRAYDVLFGLLDPKLVKFQFQVSTVAEGFSAVEYFTKYPGRFISMHAQGWDAKTKKIVPIGQGTLNWKEIFSAAKTGGIQNYFVEMDLSMMKASVPYLRRLQV